MPWQGSAPNQVYVRSDGVRTGSAVNVTADGAGVNNTAELADARENDLATALNLVLKRDGGNQPTADLPMNSHKLTGMSQGSARTDSLRIDQVQDGDLIYAEASGTANAIALTTSPSCSPVEGMMLVFIAEADSTSTVTVDLNGNGAVALQVGGGACAGGEVNNGQAHIIVFDGTQWQLANPYANGRVSAIANLAASDGNIIVGDGTTWVAESGATARTSLGLGTGDTPQFTGVELSHASANTLTGSGGDAFIEGNRLFRVGGTDVPIADGGTGASDAATAFGNLKQAASDSATGAIEIAVQSEMEAASSATLAVTPGRQHFHPGHPKAGGSLNGSGTPAFRSGDYGMGAVTDNANGDWTLALDTAFANTNFWMLLGGETSAAGNARIQNELNNGSATRTTSSVRIVNSTNQSGTTDDINQIGVSLWGDYA